MRYAEIPLAACILAAACALGLSLPRIDAPSPPLFFNAFVDETSVYEPLGAGEVIASAESIRPVAEPLRVSANEKKTEAPAAVSSAPLSGDQFVLTFPLSPLPARPSP
jgi:hypothetical protein